MDFQREAERQLRKAIDEAVEELGVSATIRIAREQIEDNQEDLDEETVVNHMDINQVQSFA